MSHIPSLNLPTSDYDQMRVMSKRRLVCVLRSAVLTPERAARFSPRPPANYDAYLVRYKHDCIEVQLQEEGSTVFRCIFEPAREY